MNMCFMIAVFLFGSILGIYVAKNEKKERMSGREVIDCSLSVSLSILSNTGGREEIVGAVRVLVDKTVGKGHAADVIVNIVSSAVPRLVAVTCYKERGANTFQETQQYRELLEDCVKKYEEYCCNTPFNGGY